MRSIPRDKLFYCDGVTQFEKVSAALLRLYDYDCRSQPWRFAAKM